MIYSFEIGDKRKKMFLEILQNANIDYDLVEHDSTVIRVLGSLDPLISSKLDWASGAFDRISLKRKAETSCFADFSDSTKLVVIAGPCAVESEEQLASTVEFLAGLGVRYLRGGAFKPRTSCESFQGLGRPGLELLQKYASRNNMNVVTEVMDRSQIKIVVEYADIIQVGSRNMFNYTLLTALGSINRPILLKRGMAATISEWLSSAQYISRGGNDSIILCERGIRTFEPQTSHTLDLAAITLAKQQADYPVIADSSHASGRPDLVTPLAAAAVAAGADGIMVEVHPEPENALSDGQQALTFEQFEKLLTRVMKIHATSRP